jgi:hypothetical protein
MLGAGSIIVYFRTPVNVDNRIEHANRLIGAVSTSYETEALAGPVIVKKVVKRAQRQGVLGEARTSLDLIWEGIRVLTRRFRLFPIL